MPSARTGRVCHTAVELSGARKWNVPGWRAFGFSPGLRAAPWRIPGGGEGAGGAGEGGIRPYGRPACMCFRYEWLVTWP